MAAQVGGFGVGVEADGIDFRAEAVRGDDGRMWALWLRYICFAEGNSRQLLLHYLGSRIVVNAGQGGGGQLADEKLYRAVFCGDVPAFREGPIAHADRARPCTSLGQEVPSLEAPPEDVHEAMALGQPDSDVRVKWRRETQEEAYGRAAAEGKPDPAARGNKKSRPGPSATLTFACPTAWCFARETYA